MCWFADLVTLLSARCKYKMRSMRVCLCEQRPEAGSFKDSNELLDFVISRTFLGQKSNNYLPNEDSGL